MTAKLVTFLIGGVIFAAALFGAGMWIGAHVKPLSNKDKRVIVNEQRAIVATSSLRPSA